MRRIARLALVLSLALAGTAQAANLVVTQAADTAPSPSGFCLSSVSCSLREAVTDADDSGLHPGADTIQLPPGTYTLPNDALPTITTDITIEGTAGAAQTTITGATTVAGSSPQGGVFTLNNFLARLTLRGVTVSGNQLTGVAAIGGGAIASAGSANVVIDRSILRDNSHNSGASQLAGGAIAGNQGSLTIADSAIEDNIAGAATSTPVVAGGVAWSNASGAGIAISRSSISRNHVDPEVGNDTVGAGGLAVDGGPALSLADSTISENGISASAAATRGGGLLIRNSPNPGGTASTLTNVTMTGNVAAGIGFGVGVGNFLPVNFATAGTRVRNSILAGGIPTNCANGSTAIASDGGNLEDADTCNFNGPGDLRNTPPQLEALRRNGGAGLSQAPLPTSPALGLARPEFCSAVDQRGLIRALVGGGACDSGAAETATLPVNTAAPSISGTAVDGQTLTCSPGTWTQNPGFGFKWLSDGAAIAGATASTFTIGAVQLETAIQCQVFAQTVAGVATATSAAVVPPKPPVVTPPAPPTPPTPPAAPVNTVRPRFSGPLRTGQKLTCAQGTFTGATSFAFAWLRNGTPIAVAKSATFTLTTSDVGKAVQCQVTATGPGGTVVAESAPGVSAKACIVPTLVGKTLAAAKKALTAANCAVGKTTTRKSPKKPATVLSSSPAKGKNLAAGTKIALTVAKR